MNNTPANTNSPMCSPAHKSIDSALFDVGTSCLAHKRTIRYRISSDFIEGKYK